MLKQFTKKGEYMSNQIKDMYVYEYQHLDDLSFIKPIEDHFTSDYFYIKPDNIEEKISEIKQLFSSHGWEGDGDIGVIWFPPFVGAKGEDTFGHYVYHVKQLNNGTSFLGSSEPLPFASLLSQDEFEDVLPGLKRSYPNKEEINIIQYDVEYLMENLFSYKNKLEHELQAVESVSDIKLNEELKEKVLGYNQCMIIYHLNDFLDHCYYNLLREVLNEGNNSNLKLSRSSAKIDLSKHYAEDEYYPRGDSWLTIEMIINDIWQSYRYESFKDKLSKLIKPLDYDVEKIVPGLKNEILKHVTIRNCIQHHNWRLEPSAVKHNIGKDSIEILQESNSTLKIKKNEKIKLTKEELIKIIEKLIVFADTLSTCVSQRVATRHYR